MRQGYNFYTYHQRYRGLSQIIWNGKLINLLGKIPVVFCFVLLGCILLCITVFVRISISSFELFKQHPTSNYIIIGICFSGNREKWMLCILSIYSSDLEYIVQFHIRIYYLEIIRHTVSDVEHMQLPNIYTRPWYISPQWWPRRDLIFLVRRDFNSVVSFRIQMYSKQRCQCISTYLCFIIDQVTITAVSVIITFASAIYLTVLRNKQSWMMIKI